MKFLEFLRGKQEAIHLEILREGVKSSKCITRVRRETITTV
jgi:hypothetical protein